MSARLSKHFPAYTDFAPRVPVWCVTPGLPGTIHRFYDTSPFSPSGRYLALTRLRVEHRRPRAGEAADVVLVDLEEGTSRTLAQTRGFDVQLGAQVQWGADDRSLFFNDVDVRTWKAFGVCLDPESGRRQRLDGPIYMLSPDGNWSASPCLLRTSRTQAGYGVVVPRRRLPANRGASPDDGIYLTDTTSGRSRLLVSISQIVEQAGAPLDGGDYRRGDFYCFHVKWNPQGTRLLVVLRWLPRSWLPWKRGRMQGRKHVITMNSDGTNARVAVADELWRRGGHHPNWCPDGEHVLMNLNLAGDGLRLVRARYDGSRHEIMAPGVRGSGHPTLHAAGNHVLTDAYPHETVAAGDGTVPIRWIDLATCSETTLVRIGTRPARGRSAALRVDPHPAWDRASRRIAFNACPDGRRMVYVADLSAYVPSAAAGAAA